MKKFSFLAAALALCLSLAACAGQPAAPDSSNAAAPSTGRIHLYGESHGVAKILEKEWELWQGYYHNDNMRHLFVELPYYTGEYLNLWMQSENDDVLNAIFADAAGTAMDDPATMDFYRKIKEECPETVFHGTDVGHQYDSTGARFLAYLEENEQEDSQQYRLAQEAIEQGEAYYKNNDGAYRENAMAENFIRAFDELNGENVMGIYGSAHTDLEAMDYNSNTVPCMARQLKERYGDAVQSEDLSWLEKDIEPLETATLTVSGKDYQASYFGQQDLRNVLEGYVSRDFWRLENAYEDFKDNPPTGDVLPYDNYPMLIETGQVFAIDYEMADGSSMRLYYRSDGNEWNGNPTTEGFTTE